MEFRRGIANLFRVTDVTLIRRKATRRSARRPMWRLAPVFLCVCSLLSFGCAVVGTGVYDVASMTLSPLPELSESQELILSEILTLDQAKQIALENSPTVQQALARISAAEARIMEARSAYFPKLDAEGAAIRTHQSPDWQTVGSERRTLYSNELSVSWVLFDGLARRARLQSARYGKLSNLAARENVCRLLLRGVVESYMGAQLADARIQIASSDAEFNTVRLDESKKKERAGSASRSEVLNFEIRVNQALSDVVTARVSRELALATLADLLGVPATGFCEVVRLEPLPSESSAVPPISIEEEVEQALQNRPDLLVQRSALEQSRLDVKASRAEFLPKVVLQGSTGHQSIEDFSTSEEDRATSYGVFAQWNLFSGGARLARLRATQARTKEQEQLVEEMTLGIVAETRQVCSQILAASEQVALTRHSLDLTEATRNLVEKEWQAGQASLTRLNEAQSDLIRAQSRFALTLIQQRQALENLRVVTAKDTSRDW
ncbi:MAG TPA: TolC family protein [bacterium]|nr:TolC family protein [bacterium]